jgi:hypothetical protein
MCIGKNYYYFLLTQEFKLFPTRGIANKGFKGMRMVVARFNFSCNLTGNRLQSLTGHAINVTCNLKKPYLV